MIFDGKEYHCEYSLAEFGHAGDLGDIIWGCSAIRLWLEKAKKERAKLYLYNRPGMTTHAMTQERAGLIAPLLNAQPWLEVEWKPFEVRSDINGFRDHHRSSSTIAGKHLYAIGMGYESHTDAVERKWFSIPPSSQTLPQGKKVIFVRSHRYRSHDFPWTSIIDWFGDQAVFLGPKHEHQSFLQDHPNADQIPWVSTSNFLEAAQIIDQADLFVGNQTSLFAVAESIKKPRILESFCRARDCEYGSRNCLAIGPGMRTTKDRILELLDAPFTI